MAQQNQPNRNAGNSAEHGRQAGQDVKHAGQEAAKAGQSGQQAVMDKTSEVTDTVKQLGSQAASAAHEQLERARNVAQEQYESLRGTASDYLQQGRDRAMQVEQDLETRIVQQPMQSILIAAGVGFFLGVLLSRR